MKDHEGDIKQYSLLSESVHAHHAGEEGIIDEVMFGFYSPDGGTSGEMAMRWHNLGEHWEKGRRVTRARPRLEVFTGSWHALAQFKDMIDALAEVDDEDISPKEFCQLLDRCGFVDATKRKEQ